MKHLNRNEFDSKSSLVMTEDLPCLSSLNDPFVVPKHMEDLFESVKSQRKGILQFAGADHTSNKFLPIYWEAIEEFVYRVLNEDEKTRNVYFYLWSELI